MLRPPLGAKASAATPVGVYQSTDAGRSWRLPGLNPSVPFADVVAPSPRFARDQTIFVCGADGLYRSTDAGDTWHRVLVGSRMLCVVVSAAGTPEMLVVLVGTEVDGILISQDRGRTWTGANAGLLDLTILSLAISPCFETDRLRDPPQHEVELAGSPGCCATNDDLILRAPEGRVSKDGRNLVYSSQLFPQLRA